MAELLRAAGAPAESVPKLSVTATAVAEPQSVGDQADVAAKRRYEKRLVIRFLKRFPVKDALAALTSLATVWICDVVRHFVFNYGRSMAKSLPDTHPLRCDFGETPDARKERAVFSIRAQNVPGTVASLREVPGRG